MCEWAQIQNFQQEIIKLISCFNSALQSLNKNQ